MLNITIHKTDAPKEKPAKGTALGFGNLFTDHMFLMDYSPDQGCTMPASCPTVP